MRLTLIKTILHVRSRFALRVMMGGERENQKWSCEREPEAARQWDKKEKLNLTNVQEKENSQTCCNGCCLT